MAVRRMRAGLSLVEVATGLGVMGVVALGVVQVTNDQNQASRALASAVQLEQMRAGAHDWMRANYQQLAANLPVGGAPVLVPVARTVPGGAVPGPVTVGAATLPSLQGGGFVPGTMVDRNAYGHSHAVLVRQNAPGSLEALVVQRGGQAVRDADLGRIVQRVGNAGGARFATNTNPAMATMVQGNAGSWVADTAVWTAGGVAPQVSRAAAVTSFGNASMLSDFVNRYDIGIPEANTMRTALNMGANDLTNAATVRANQAVLQNGGMACAGNAAGCAFWISDDGRFADFNDGWVRFQGQNAGAGLSIEGAGGNLNVAQNAGVGGNVGAGGSVSAGTDLWVGRDGTFGRNVGLSNDLFVGRNAGVTGDMSSARVWTGYLNSSGSVDTQTLNVGQSAAIWGAGGLWVANNAAVGGQFNVGGNVSAGGNISTPNSVFGGYMRSAGSVDAGMDLNATRNVTAGSYMWSGGGIDGAFLNSRGGANVAGQLFASTVVGGPGGWYWTGTGWAQRNSGIDSNGNVWSGAFVAANNLVTVQSASPWSGCWSPFGAGALARSNQNDSLMICSSGGFWMPLRVDGW